jgi:hypothetical protein
MKKRLLPMLLVFGLLVACSTDDRGGLLKKRAYEVLRYAKVVTDRAELNPGGMCWENTWAFSYIYKCKDARDIFKDLADSKAVYGLIGLYYTDKGLFAEALKQYDRNDEIYFRSLDMSFNMSIGELVDEDLKNKSFLERLLIDPLPDVSNTMPVPVPRT